MGVTVERKAAEADVNNMINEFDSSEDEQGEEVDLSPLKVDWLDLSSVGFSTSLGISGLPGCRFNETWRSLMTDIEYLREEGITDIFVLCTRGELRKYRVPRLLQELTTAEFSVHHYPFPDGLTPSFANCAKLLEDMRVNIASDRKCLVHCYGGLGRSCLIAACFLLMMSEDMESETAIDKVRALRGHSAIQTIKQFNYVNDFRKMYKEYEESQPCNELRSISR
ncbi:cyclin-dependent kinase inhibitor 3-like [Amphiura filiformis]|uniref:cyclin-dependent kinase inhibitor 3-like n=1 Tax=Amphiura filiformis TaxID=82378 RepID=UPI003B221DFC